MKSSNVLRTPAYFLWVSFKQFRWPILLMWLLISVGNFTGYFLPYFLKLMADYAAATPLEDIAWTGFAFAFWMAVAFIVVNELSYRVSHLVEAFMYPKSIKWLNSTLFDYTVDQSSAYFEERSSGTTGHRFQQITKSMEYFLTHVPWHITNHVASFFTSALLLYIANPAFLIMYFAWFAIFIPFSYLLWRWQYRTTHCLAEVQAGYQGQVVDVLSNVRVVHAFAANRNEKKKNNEKLTEYKQAEFKYCIAEVCEKLFTGVWLRLLVVGLIYLGIRLFLEGRLTVGDFLIIAATIPTIKGSIWGLGEAITTLIRNYGEFSNAVNDLNSEAAIQDTGHISEVPQQAAIQFEHVSFKYPKAGTTLLDDISLTIKAGERVGLVGHSGVGKTTLIKLLFRYYDLNEGEGVIRIGGTPITDFKLDTLRQSMTYVPQSASLFHRNIHDNIVYGFPEANQSEVEMASTRAGAHEFIASTPQQYQTRVGERGVKLSGGQRQRIAIARAMMKSSPILVLDEATSALDSASEQMIQDSLESLFEGKTVLAIAHRLSTLRSMDRVIVMDAGKIVERGAPSELLQRENSRFKKMWETQRSGFIE